MYCGGHGHTLPCPECAKNLANRRAAEQAYTINAFDYVSNPVGSRDWCLFFDGWRAALDPESYEQIENTLHVFGDDTAARRQAEGAIEHTRRVVGPFNYNGGERASTPRADHE